MFLLIFACNCGSERRSCLTGTPQPLRTPAASPGIVTAINQKITTQADGIAASETLTP